MLFRSTANRLNKLPLLLLPFAGLSFPSLLVERLVLPDRPMLKLPAFPRLLGASFVPTVLRRSPGLARGGAGGGTPFMTDVSDLERDMRVTVEI